MENDEQEIRQLVEKWFTASKKCDTQTVLSLMTEDAIFMLPGQAPFGKEQFAASAAQMQNMRLDGKYDIKEIKVLGDWAYLRNYIEMSLTQEGGAPVRHSGYTLTIFQKTSDGWKLARDANLLTKQEA